MVKVSVIIAVYAAEKYLRRCLDSLMQQSLKEIELVLVDDGSRDSSGQICDAYAKQNSRIRVVHKQNEGVSATRQKGLEMASGEYVIHVDPDDWVESTMLSDMYECAKRDNADMVICDYITELPQRSVRERQSFVSLNSKDVFFSFLANANAFCWNKLVKRALFEKFNIGFPRQMVVWEDAFVNCSLTLNSLKISYLPIAYYHYDKICNENSLMRNFSEKKLKSMIFFIDYFSKNEVYGSLLDYLLEKKMVVKRYVFFYMNPRIRDVKNLYPEVNKYLKSSNNKIDKLIHIGLSYSWKLSRILLFMGKLFTRMKKK